MYSKSCLHCANSKQKRVPPNYSRKRLNFEAYVSGKSIHCHDVNVILEPITSLKSETAIPPNIDVYLVSETIKGSRYEDIADTSNAKTNSVLKVPFYGTIHSFVETGFL